VTVIGGDRRPIRREKRDAMSHKIKLAKSSDLKPKNLESFDLNINYHCFH